MSKLAKVAGVGVLVILGLVGGVALWAKTAADSTLAQTFEVHKAEFPVPFPLTEAEVEALRAEKLAAMSPAPTDDALVSNAGSSGAAGSGAEPVDPLAGVDLAALAMERAIAQIPEVVSCHYISGTGTFELQVVAQDLEHFSRFALGNLINLPNEKDLHTSFSLGEVKAGTPLPLRHLVPDAAR